MRVSFAKPLMLAFLFFGLVTSAAIAATTISINAGGGISGGSGATYVSSCDSDITMNAQTIMNSTTSQMEVATVLVGGLDMRYPQGCGGNVLDLTYLLNGIPTYASFNIPNTGVSSGTFVLSSPSNTCNQSNSSLTSFSATTLSSVAIAPNFSSSYQSASAYLGTSIVSSNLVVNLNASTYSGSGNTWTNSVSGGNTYDATAIDSPPFTSFGSGSCFTFSASKRFTFARPAQDAMTIGVWFKTIEQGGGTYPPSSAYQFWSTNYLIGGDATGSANDYGIGLSNGHIVWGIGAGGSDAGGSANSYSTNTYNDGTWHYVTVTRSHPSCALQIYVDGVLDLNNGSCSGSTSLNASALLTIGADNTYINNNGGTWHGMRGSIAAVHAYDRVLSGSEILQNYNALKSNFGRS
jgi:hypothetical protein